MPDIPLDPPDHSSDDDDGIVDLDGLLQDGDLPPLPLPTGDLLQLPLPTDDLPQLPRSTELHDDLINLPVAHAASSPAPVASKLWKVFRRGLKSTARAMSTDQSADAHALPSPVVDDAWPEFDPPDFDHDVSGIPLHSPDHSGDEYDGVTVESPTAEPAPASLKKRRSGAVAMSNVDAWKLRSALNTGVNL